MGKHSKEDLNKKPVPLDRDSKAAGREFEEQWDQNRDRSNGRPRTDPPRN